MVDVGPLYFRIIDLTDPSQHSIARDILRSHHPSTGYSILSLPPSPFDDPTTTDIHGSKSCAKHPLHLRRSLPHLDAALLRTTKHLPTDILAITNTNKRPLHTSRRSTPSDTDRDIPPPNLRIRRSRSTTPLPPPRTRHTRKLHPHKPPDPRRSNDIPLLRPPQPPSTAPLPPPTPGPSDLRTPGRQRRSALARRRHDLRRRARGPRRAGDGEL